MGYVHSMTHQLGAVYPRPYCVCCVILLLVVERDSAKRLQVFVCNVAKALGNPFMPTLEEIVASYKELF